MKRKVLDNLIKSILIFLGLIAVGLTLFVFIYVLYRGRRVISIRFLLDNPSGIPFGTAGGVFPAIIGTLMLGGLSALIGGLLGILNGLYLSLYSKGTKSGRILLHLITILSGLPSIIFGLIAYTLLIYKLGMGKSLLCSAITISAMILPFITIRAKKIFDEKGYTFFIESESLGLSKPYIIRKLIIPNCLGELVGAVSLGMLYGMGAVAPILYTGVVMNAPIPTSVNSPFMSLPYHLYMLANSGYSDEYALGTAFVLLAMLIIIEILCHLFASFREGVGFKRIFR
ncbi:MAG: ABC transporter permease subunit [Lachnospiraceae bacterium]|jgi:phosphate transport system permease protein|nr:ABC transporter permease subunit [Lachnospiraceae bacterium]